MTECLTDIFASVKQSVKRWYKGGKPLLLVRHDHGVDDMDDTIGRLDVGFYDFGIVNADAVGRIDRYLSALDRLHHHFLARDVLRHHLSRHNVIGQYRNEPGPVLGLEKAFDCSGWKFSERSVVRREHCERPRALQGIDKASCLDRGDERRE